MKWTLLLVPFGVITYIYLVREFASLFFNDPIAIDFIGVMLPIVTIGALVGMIVDKRL